LAIVVMLIVSQLFWIGRVLDLEERFILESPGPPGSRLPQQLTTAFLHFLCLHVEIYVRAKQTCLRQILDHPSEALYSATFDPQTSVAPIFFLHHKFAIDLGTTREYIHFTLAVKTSHKENPADRKFKNLD
jgi:hypothetical protein